MILSNHNITFKNHLKSTNLPQVKILKLVINLRGNNHQSLTAAGLG